MSASLLVALGSLTLSLSQRVRGPDVSEYERAGAKYYLSQDVHKSQIPARVADDVVAAYERWEAGQALPPGLKKKVAEYIAAGKKRRDPTALLQEHKPRKSQSKKFKMESEGTTTRAFVRAYILRFSLFLDCDR